VRRELQGSRSSCRAATQLNNDAVAGGSQVPETGKSRKPLPRRNCTVDFANTAVQIRSRLRYLAEAGGRPLRRLGAGDALPEISDFAAKF